MRFERQRWQGPERLAVFRDKLIYIFFLSVLGFLELCHMAEPHHSKAPTPGTLSQHIAHGIPNIDKMEPA